MNKKNFSSLIHIYNLCLHYRMMGSFDVFMYVKTRGLSHVWFWEIWVIQSFGIKKKKSHTCVRHETLMPWLPCPRQRTISEPSKREFLKRVGDKVKRTMNEWWRQCGRRSDLQSWTTCALIFLVPRNEKSASGHFCLSGKHQERQSEWINHVIIAPYQWQRAYLSPRDLS